MGGDAANESVADLLAKYRGRTLRSHRDAELTVSLRDPRRGDEIEAALKAAGVELKGTLLDFLRIADGMDFFGVPILGAAPVTPDAQTMLRFPEMLQYQLVPFHDWGNGDFDCVDLTKAVDDEPPVVFWDDKRDTTVMITHGFGKWLGMVVEDLEKYGKLLHPDDYRTAEFTGATGVYESPANIREAFFGDAPPPRPPTATDPATHAPTGKRSRLKSWVGRKLRGR